MDGNGLDLRTWLTVVGLFALFFGLPAVSLVRDQRKRTGRRQLFAWPSRKRSTKPRTTTAMGKSCSCDHVRSRS